MAVTTFIFRALRGFYLPSGSLVTKRFASRNVREETDEEHNKKYVTLFLHPEIDNWTVRKLMNDLQGMDRVPEPIIIDAALRACRRLNDYALAVRFLEAVKFKCGRHVDKIWPYVLQEIDPTLKELGVDTPEQLGYDKPELYLKSVYED